MLVSSFLTYISSLIKPKVYPFGHPLSSLGRSSKWPALRDKFIKEKKVCCISNSTVDLEVHHFKPFFLFPELELEWENLRLISRPYHYLIGHLCNWRSWNEQFDEDVIMWKIRIELAKTK